MVLKFKSFKELGQQFKAKAEDINKLGTPEEAARIMKILAQSYAPIWSGDTKRGITKKKYKDGYIVRSYVEGNFKQNLFANREPGKFLYDNNGQKYGEGFKHYSAIKTPFWTIAKNETEKAFPKLVFQEIKNIFNRKN